MADTLLTGSVTNQSASNADSLASGPPFALAIGDRVFIHVKHEGSAISSPSTNLTVTTAGGNTCGFVSYTSHGNGDLHAGLFECTVTTIDPAATFTAHFPVGGRPFEVILTVGSRPGIGDTEVFDTSAAATGTSNAPSTGSVAVVPGGNGFAAMFVAEYTGGTHTPGSGWTEGSDPGGPYSEYRVLTSESSITGNSAWVSTNAWITSLISDKTAGAATGQPISIRTNGIPGMRLGGTTFGRGF